MTISEILDGPMTDRSNADARNGVPMTVAEVRMVIATMERKTKSKAARLKMADMGAANIAKRISADGVALYAAYAAALRGAVA